MAVSIDPFGTPVAVERPAARGPVGVRSNCSVPDIAGRAPVRSERGRVGTAPDAGGEPVATESGVRRASGKADGGVETDGSRVVHVPTVSLAVLRPHLPCR